MLWEAMRCEADRSVREGEMARDRRALQHLRELQVSQEEPHDAGRHYVERSIGWLVRTAQMAASWLA